MSMTKVSVNVPFVDNRSATWKDAAELRRIWSVVMVLYVVAVCQSLYDVVPAVKSVRR